MANSRIWQNGGSRSPRSEVGFNSTTTALSGSATFTGEWEENDYPEVGVSTKTDVAGTLYFDFSNDGGANYDTFPSGGFVLSAGIHEFHTAVKLGRAFRTRIVNGASDQTYLRHYTYFGENFRLPSAPMNQPIGLDSDASIMRTPFPFLDYSRGLWTGVKVVKKFGANASIGTGLTPVCSAGVYPTPTSAVSLEFVSSSASDALNSTGAHEITVVGIAPDWTEQTVSTAAHATDGTTAVAITGTWLRIFRAYVSKSGVYASSSAASHVGTITVRVAGGGATYARL